MSQFRPLVHDFRLCAQAFSSLHQQACDCRGLRQENSQQNQNQIPVFIPQRFRPETDYRAGRHAAFLDAQAFNRAPVHHRCSFRRHINGYVFRVGPGEHAQRQLPRPCSEVFRIHHRPAQRPGAERPAAEHIHRHAGLRCEHLCYLRRVICLPGHIAQNRAQQNHRAFRQRTHETRQFRHRAVGPEFKLHPLQRLRCFFYPSQRRTVRWR